MELDFSLEELSEQVVKPYLTGQTFMCAGQPIDAFFVDKIRISESDEPSADMMPRLKAEEKRKSIDRCHSASTLQMIDSSIEK